MCNQLSLQYMATHLQAFQDLLTQKLLSDIGQLSFENVEVSCEVIAAKIIHTVLYC